uniref:Retrovirus-related Pol polyprotein from transposon TNT 1-94 n=1 Tax=Tanacetum cinerariifolium TaxID=118510 RepID=A0A699J325_TANCI|nr:retrovirus-related Pol polyprotein from transposon TNT 1-94 [Tanacetum cinerariifolium]
MGCYSSGSPTTPSDISLSEYDSFMFDLSINPFPPADRSDSYEFTDELIPFISAPEYDCFRFTDEPNSRDFTKDVVENISPTKEPQVLTILPTHPTLQLNLKFQPSSESLFAYVFLVYSVVPPYLLSLRNEDIIFDPDICKYHFSKPDISHRCRPVKKFNTHRSHLNTFPMLINGQNNPPLDVLLDGEHLDKIKEKGDLCILVGYSTQSKRYRVYNKRTRMTVESVYIRFDEIKEVSETSVANDTLSLVPQRQKASDYDNSNLVPQLQNVSSSADAHVPSRLMCSLLSF